MSFGGVGEPGIESVLCMSAEMVPESGAFIVAVKETALLQQGNDFVDEGVNSVLVDVDGYPETVARTRFEPFLKVVRCR